MLEAIRSLLTRLAIDSGGATAVEYGLVAALMSLGAFYGFTAVRDSLNNMYYAITAAFTAAMPS